MNPVRRSTRALPTAALAASLMALSALAAPSAAAAGAMHATQILSGYDKPVLVTNTGAANRRIFIVEQSGKIKIAAFKAGAWHKVGLFLDLSSIVDFDGGERGLLGLAFAPDYATSRRLYVSYTARANGSAYGPDVVVEYLRKTSNRADAASARMVLAIPDPYENHNGGDIAFGPDHKLYWGTGDGGSGGDPQDRAQNLDAPLGKMLRIDPRDPDGAGGRSYSVPSDNPFVGQAGRLPEIWAFGLRNPWRWGFDRLSGDLWIGDVGQNQTEEIDRARAVAGVDAGKGVNYGWNRCEGKHVYGSSAACTVGVLPVYTYDHDQGCAVIGGQVYRGTESPAWDGTYVFSDNCSNVISAMRFDGSRPFTAIDTNLSISGFGEDAAGRLYVTSLGGTISSLTFTGSPS